MKNILHIVTSLNPKRGGVAEAIRSYEVGIQQVANIEIGERHVVCFDSQEDVCQWDNKGLKVYGMGEMKKYWGYNPNFLTWLNDNFNKYEVIIIHGLWQYHSFAVNSVLQKVKRRKNVFPRVFIMPHGMLDPWFQRDKSRKLKAIRNEIYWRLIEKKVVNNADGLFFTCEQEMLLARETFEGYRPKKELIVGLGIDHPPSFTAQMSEVFFRSFPSVNSQKYILFLGRIDFKKGVDLLLQAYSDILNENPAFESPMLVIAGPGLETTFGKQMQEFVEINKSLKNKVIFTGMLTGDAKWGAIYGCEAFILPSHQENFGIAVAEALACGKPVLISNQVNIWKEIDSMKAGIVADDTLEGTTLLLKKFTNLSYTEKQQMEANALETYQRFFNIETVGKIFFSYLK